MSDIAPQRSARGKHGEPSNSPRTFRGGVLPSPPLLLASGFKTPSRRLLSAPVFGASIHAREINLR
jgi:hypothetical protein